MSVSLRKATTEDCDLVYGWANDPVTRAMSFSTEPIPYDNHVKWYEKLMSNSPERLLLIMEDAGNPVGQMRLDVVSEAGDLAGCKSLAEDITQTVELSYTIAPEKRGMGYGNELIRLTIEYICEHQDIYPGKTIVIAQVKVDNLGSRKMLEANAFSVDKEENGVIHLVYTVK